MQFRRSLGTRVRSHGLSHLRLDSEEERPRIVLDMALLRRAFRSFLPYRPAGILILFAIGRHWKTSPSRFPPAGSLLWSVPAALARARSPI